MRLALALAIVLPCGLLVACGDESSDAPPSQAGAAGWATEHLDGKPSVDQPALLVSDGDDALVLMVTDDGVLQSHLWMPVPDSRPGSRWTSAGSTPGSATSYGSTTAAGWRSATRATSRRTGTRSSPTTRSGVAQRRRPGVGAGRGQRLRRRRRVPRPRGRGRPDRRRGWLPDARRPEQAAASRRGPGRATTAGHVRRGRPARTSPTTAATTTSPTPATSSPSTATCWLSGADRPARRRAVALRRRRRRRLEHGWRSALLRGVYSISGSARSGPPWSRARSGDRRVGDPVDRRRRDLGSRARRRCRCRRGAEGWAPPVERRLPVLHADRESTTCPGPKPEVCYADLAQCGSERRPRTPRSAERRRSRRGTLVEPAVEGEVDEIVGTEDGRLLVMAAERGGLARAQLACRCRTCPGRRLPALPRGGRAW